jgi:hypothetical protein
MADFDPIPPLAPPLRDALAQSLTGIPAKWPAALDVDAFISIVEQHGIAPLLYSRLGDAAPAPLRERLRDVAIHAAAMEPRRLADLREVLAALASNGIQPLIVKGSALAYSLYPQPDLRPRGDTDLLIDINELPAVRATFRALAFEERMMPAAEETYRQTTFMRGGHLYDVHWSITITPVFADLLAVSELRARSIALPAIGDDARTISDVDALLYACIHRVAHHHGSERLIWLADVDLLRTRMSAEEHRRFWEVAEERAIVGICASTIELTNEWFGGEPHGLPQHLINRDEPTRAWLEHGRTRGAEFAAELAATRSWRARARRLRQLAFPSREFMRAQFGSHSPLLLPWFYAWRGVRGVARLFRRVA